jgi:hypothetical protein
MVGKLVRQNVSVSLLSVCSLKIFKTNRIPVSIKLIAPQQSYRKTKMEKVYLHEVSWCGF